MFGMGTGVPSSLSLPVHLHIQAVSFNKDNITILIRKNQVFFGQNDEYWEDTEKFMLFQLELVILPNSAVLNGQC